MLLSNEQNEMVAVIVNELGNTRKAVDEIANLVNCSIKDAGNLMTPYFTKKREIYSLRTREVVGYALSNIRVSKNQQFCVYLDVLEMFHSPHECYMYLMEGYRLNLLPRSGGNEGRPLSTRSIELYECNRALGYRHWVWLQRHPGRHVAGYDYVCGYGYETADGYTIVNNDGTPFVSIEGDTRIL